MKYFVLYFLSLLFLATTAHAAEWKSVDLPAYSNDIHNIAIGSDGLLYEVTSNPNGYVFASILDQFRFEPTGRFTGEIMAKRNAYYLGTSCDAEGEGHRGTWTKDGTGLNFAISAGSAMVLSFRLLSTELEPSHSC
ncbi:MAG: hypothetical protein ABJL55_07775 [Roseibium sp.]